MDTILEYKVLKSGSKTKMLTLGDVAEYINGRAFKPSEWDRSGVPIIRIQNLNNSKAAFNFSNGEFEARYRVKKGDLLFAWSATLGAYIWRGDDAWLNQHIFKVIPNEGVDKYYLYYFLCKVVDELYAKSHGSGMVHITKRKFEATKLALPPIAQQQTIVSKIEQLFSELDKAIEYLKTAQQQLKTYRQSVLKWAFEGRLTNENVKEGELPEGWVWRSFGDVHQIMSNLVDPKKSPDLPHIAPDNISKGTGKLLDYRTIGEDKVFSPKHAFYKGQILYSKIQSRKRKNKN